MRLARTAGASWHTLCRTKPIVVLSEDLVRQPEATLRAMCGEMGIDFDPAMMSWQPGPKPYDGCWASWWYTAVHKSNGALQLLRRGS